MSDGKKAWAMDVEDQERYIASLGTNPGKKKLHELTEELKLVTDQESFTKAQFFSLSQAIELLDQVTGNPRKAEL